MSTGIIVADASRARLLTAQSNTAPLEEIADFSHTASRQSEQQLVSDRVGTGNEAGGHGRHSIGHEKNAHKREAETFSRELAEEISRLSTSQNWSKIYLISPPKFLGMLRTHINKETMDLVAGQIDKNLCKSSLDEIKSHLPQFL